MSEEVGVGEFAPHEDNKIFAGRKKSESKEEYVTTVAARL